MFRAQLLLLSLISSEGALDKVAMEIASFGVPTSVFLTPHSNLGKSSLALSRINSIIAIITQST